jgi:hypothetical protein
VRLLRQRAGSACLCSAGVCRRTTLSHTCFALQDLVGNTKANLQLIYNKLVSTYRPCHVKQNAVWTAPASTSPSRRHTSSAAARLPPAAAAFRQVLHKQRMRQAIQALHRSRPDPRRRQLTCSAAVAMLDKHFLLQPSPTCIMPMQHKCIKPTNDVPCLLACHTRCMP